MCERNMRKLKIIRRNGKREVWTEGRKTQRQRKAMKGETQGRRKTMVIKRLEKFVEWPKAHTCHLATFF